MRVNHVGEVCAQALYQGQALTCRDAAIRQSLEAAADEEVEHLAWTAGRLAELGGRKSLLNPLWYLGAWSIGALAGRCGDTWSLGFLAETERQSPDQLQLCFCYMMDLLGIVTEKMPREYFHQIPGRK